MDSSIEADARSTDEFVATSTSNVELSSIRSGTCHKKKKQGGWGGGVEPQQGFARNARGAGEVLQRKTEAEKKPGKNTQQAIKHLLMERQRTREGEWTKRDCYVTNTLIKRTQSVGLPSCVCWEDRGLERQQRTIVPTFFFLDNKKNDTYSGLRPSFSLNVGASNNQTAHKRGVSHTAILPPPPPYLTKTSCHAHNTCMYACAPYYSRWHPHHWSIDPFIEGGRDGRAAYHAFEPPTL